LIKYILRRILVFIPTLIIISLMAFVISVAAPGDPVERLVNASGNEGKNANVSEELKQKKRHELGLDLPVFYVSLGSLADCDTLYKISDKARRENLAHLTSIYGNWDKISAYYHALQQTNAALNSLQSQANTNETKDAILHARYTLISLMETAKDEAITNKIDTLNKLFSYITSPKSSPKERTSGSPSKLMAGAKPAPLYFGEGLGVRSIQQTYLDLKTHATPWKIFVPRLVFNGLHNQYHRWMFGSYDGTGMKGSAYTRGVIFGDFGISYQDQQPITTHIREKFAWSFFLSLFSIIISYVISIPIGVYAAYRKGSLFDKASGFVLFALYSVPTFFMGLVLLLLFANPDVLNWFPESGVQNPAVFDEHWSLFQKICHHAPYLVLPLITYAYSSFAFISRQMRVGMLEVMGQDYIRTARAKGLSEKSVVLKHALKNGLLPIITVFSTVFPAAIAGSVIIETIFSIPGMGMEIYEAILNLDFPMIVAVFTITGVLTLIGYLVADILYALADPRISYIK